jgi:hypothetical protein
MKNGRKKPYTKMGIKRLDCSVKGCKNKAEFQWQICADNNLYRPICRKHDIEMNRVVLQFIKDPDKIKKMREYEN